VTPLRLLIFTQGEYGRRIRENVSRRAPPGWTIRHTALPSGLPQIVEEPEELVEGLDLSGEWDLVVFLGESPSAFSLLPAILKRASARAVIAPADDYSWLPMGLERQLRYELGALSVDAVFPRTFCALSPVGIPPVDEFARKFGSPKLSIESEDGVVKKVEVLRGAPCGSTGNLAERLPGAMVEGAAEKGALLVQTYPCIASRHVDRLFSDAPIHVAGRLAQRAVRAALEAEEAK
jgi:hypothetical protein